MKIIGHVYGLVNPNTKEVFYIGHSTKIKLRFARHKSFRQENIQNFSLNNPIHNYCREHNIKPELKIIKEVFASAEDKIYNTSLLSNAEFEEIKKALDIGLKLVNRYTKRAFIK